MAKQTTSRPRTPRDRTTRSRTLEPRPVHERRPEPRRPNAGPAAEGEPRLGPYEIRYSIELGYAGGLLG